MKMWTVFTTAAVVSASIFAYPLAAEAKGRSHHKTESHKEEPQCSTCAFSEAMDKMHRGMNITYTGDTDLDFVNGMIPHHQGAVDMAKVELKFGKDPKIMEFAKWIVFGQGEEIGLMTTWAAGRNNAAAPKKETEEVGAYKVAMATMHCDMMIDYTGDADLDFVRGMIPHHQGAVAMAAIELRSGSNQEIHKLASNIFNSQQQEIAMMKEWLETHTPPAPAKPVKKKLHHKKKPAKTTQQ